MRIDGLYVSKICSQCNKEKLATDFYSCNRKYGGGIRPECKTCTSKNKKKRYDPKKQRNFVLKRLYNINTEIYESMLKEQGGSCKICKKKPSYKKHLAVDHCHKTGKVRGLLCGNCNTAIGKFNDDVNIMLKAINYLGEHSE